MKINYCTGTIVLALIFGTSVFAAEMESEVVQAPKNSIEEAFTNGKVSGELKYFYHHIERAVSDNTFANALGGNLKYSTDTAMPIFATAAFHTSQPIFGRSDSQKGIALFEGDTDDQLTAISEAYMGWHDSKNQIIVGDFRLDTPMMNDDTTRIVPFSYQGAAITSSQIPDIKVELNYITQIREMNSDDYSRDDIPGLGNIGNAGITMLGLTYSGISGLKLKSYYYYAPDYYSTFVAQSDYVYTIDESSRLLIGAQYFNSGNGGEFAPVATANNGGPDIDLIAFQAGYVLDTWITTLNYSQNFGLSGIVRGYGGLAQVYTTSMLANGRGNNKPETWMLKTNYTLPATSWGKTDFGMHLTHTRTKELDGYDFDALYLHVKQNFTKNDYLFVRYETFDYKDKVGQSKPKENLTAFRLILSHKF